MPTKPSYNRSFFSDVNHDVRNTMNVLMMGVTGLVEESEISAEQDECLEIIEDCCDSLHSTFRSLVDLFRLEKGAYEKANSEFDLRGVVRRVVRELSMFAESRDVELFASMTDELPATITGDAGATEQLLAGLLQGAVYAVETGSLHIHVDVEERDGENTKVAFYLTHMTKSGEPGSDLSGALFETDMTNLEFGPGVISNLLSAKILDVLGGNISHAVPRTLAEMEPFSKGNTLCIAVGFGCAEEATGDGATQEESFADRRVLVVSSNPIERWVLASKLSRWKINVEFANSGQEALDEIVRAKDSGQAYDQFLISAQLSDMDGFQLVGRFKPHDELIAASTMLFGMKELRYGAVRCGELGVKSFLARPFFSEELHAVLMFSGASNNWSGKQIVAQAGGTSNARGNSGSCEDVRVLIAEDNHANQLMVRRLLEKKGCIVTTVENGAEAVERLGSDEFDIVLMDIQMPVMDGFEAARNIRQNDGCGDVPIVALTGRTESGDAELCKEAGMDAYIAKPLKASQLYEIVSRLALKRS